MSDSADDLYQGRLALAPYPSVQGGSCGYVPILKSLGGEYRALASTSPEVLRLLTPLIEVRARTDDDGAIVGRSPIRNLAKNLQKHIPPRFPFFLDFPWMNGC